MNIQDIYMSMALAFREASHCERKKVACLIIRDNHILADGLNGTIPGFDNCCEDSEGETKPEVLHAESNALMKLARSHNSSEGADLYVTFSPCLSCAKLIIQAKIKNVYYYDKHSDSSGINLMIKAGLTVCCLKS